MKRVWQNLVAAFFLALPCAAEVTRNEAYYRDAWAGKHGGKTEVRMADGTRCDVVTATHAVEVEWAHKWAEGIGQSLWYSFQTNKKAGLVLILRNDKDREHVMRVRSLVRAKGLAIEVWEVNSKGG